MKLTYSSALLAAILCVLAAGCGDSSAFDEGVAKGVAQAEPFQLDSEQVTMSPTQLACGATSELWETPVVPAAIVLMGSERTVSHLQPKGRSLNFSDDVSSDEAGHAFPYTQVRGKFHLQVDQVLSIKDGDDKDTKIVQARVGVRIADPCFDTPLYIMGVKKGQYRDDLPATLQYERYGEGWHLTKILHY